MNRYLWTIIAPMTIGFTVTLAIRWPRHQQPARPVLSAEVRATDSSATTLPVVAASPPVSTQSTTSSAASASAPQAPPIDIPPSDDAGPALPLFFAVSSHRAPLPSDDDDVSATPGIERQVDLVNNSDDILNVTVVAVNPPTREQTQALVMMPPHQQAHVGSDSGVKLEPGYQVMLRSRGYREMTQVVN